jgi:5-methylcytosine-specific restriction endonuclease McrA
LNANPGYCRAHGAAYSESSRRWRKANPEKIREKARRRNAWKRAARRAALHPVTRAQIDARFAIWGNRCAFCGADAPHQRNHGRQRLTVEHVLALTKGGLDEASNIIPACSACNSSKSNSPIEDWYRQQEWFTEPRWAKIRKHCPAAVVGQLPLALAA